MDVIKYVVDKNRAYAQVLEERDSTGSLLVSYLYGHDLLAQTRGTATHYYHYDGLSSTRLLSDISGTITDTYIYDAYGLLLDSTGSTSNPYLYRGEQYDPELKAYYLRARYYQPGIGRFVTTDPVEGSRSMPITQHRYLYGNADPVNNLDPYPLNFYKK
jgi:RHS repeat-associated protein